MVTSGRDPFVYVVTSTPDDENLSNFVRRVELSRPVAEGMPRDRYDHASATYFIVRDSERRICARARMLPTTSPCPLADIDRRVIEQFALNGHPSVWELSNFSLSVVTGYAKTQETLGSDALELFDSIRHFAASHSIRRLLTLVSLPMERLLMRAQIPAHRVAVPRNVRGMLCAALCIEVTAGSPFDNHVH